MFAAAAGAWASRICIVETHRPLLLFASTFAATTIRPGSSGQHAIWRTSVSARFVMSPVCTSIGMPAGSSSSCQAMSLRLPLSRRCAVTIVCRPLGGDWTTQTDKLDASPSAWPRSPLSVSRLTVRSSTDNCHAIRSARSEPSRTVVTISRLDPVPPSAAIANSLTSPA
jgi:hypothetical protein